MDASVEKVQKVHENPHSDRLDIVTVSNYQCVTSRGQFKPEDEVFYIRADAALAKPEEHPWQQPFLKYLAGGGRVKTVCLRKVFSSGILVPAAELPKADIEQLKLLQQCKVPGQTAADYAKFLEDKFGVIHYVNWANQINDKSALHNYLPFGLPKSDEETWQNLDEQDLGLGTTGLVTKKLDGSSCTCIASPSGEWHVCSRSMELRPECDNAYTRAVSPWKEKILAWAKKHDKIIACRGEVTGENLNANGANLDCKGPAKFNLYGTWFPEDRDDIHLYKGLYGTKNHFLKVNEDLGLPTVPIIGEAVLTKELLQKYVDMPASFGEGVVINWREGSYKSKSNDYYSKI